MNPRSAPAVRASAPRPGADALAYEDGIKKLTERVRQMHASQWSPTPTRKAIESIAARLKELADLLDEQGVAQFDIEAAHNRPPEPIIGIDGRPAPVEDWGCSYNGTVGYMRDLAGTARRVAAELPNSREKPALPFAAMGLLHLRYRYGHARPTLYGAGPDVEELRRVTEAAGIVLSAVRLRNALATALREFDPHFVPDYFRELFR